MGTAASADFEKEIRPLLQKHCVECHDEKKQKGELRLDAKAFAFKGGHDGAAIVPGKADASPLFQRITSSENDDRMPPKGEPLSAAQIAAVKAWIEGGAVWPESDSDRTATADKRAALVGAAAESGFGFSGTLRAEARAAFDRRIYQRIAFRKRIGDVARSRSSHAYSASFV